MIPAEYVSVKIRIPSLSSLKISLLIRWLPSAVPKATYMKIQKNIISREYALQIMALITLDVRIDVVFTGSVNVRYPSSVKRLV